ncbi:acyltransferase domain-containing protein [Mycoavidus sp. SF9855]|uniref:acyltransferase domain-containing protein n=1 Tax=Mycoavidus sp. SF9855 TaxID=2968475 RepID=UPI00211C24CC|nr:acyltransferase domain-containing protein [Mycoavidus sp. SF9855]UUM20747.1 acyltransferase domain-containing protein [Mycoavidus sp. SF9855]
MTAPMSIANDLMAAPLKTGGANCKIFMYGGQGTQYFQMGRQLYDENPVFRRQLDACSAIVEPELGQSLAQILYDDRRQSHEPFNAILHTHPALFSIGYSLTAVMRAAGIEPGAVLGYSLGEYIGLTVAGGLSWQDGLRLVMRQAQIFANDCLPGGMMSVLAPFAHFDEYPDIYQGVELAGVNFAKNFCVAGPRTALMRVKTHLTEIGVLSQDLPVQYPFHSSYIESMRDQIMATADGVAMRPPRLPCYSPAYGRMIEASDLINPGEYIWNIVRQKVDFYALMRTLASAASANFFVDLSATGSLANFIKYMSLDTKRYRHAINQFGKDVASLSTLLQELAVP